MAGGEEAIRWVSQREAQISDHVTQSKGDEAETHMTSHFKHFYKYSKCQSSNHPGDYYDQHSLRLMKYNFEAQNEHEVNSKLSAVAV